MRFGSLHAFACISFMVKRNFLPEQVVTKNTQHELFEWVKNLDNANLKHLMALHTFKGRSISV